MKHVLINLAIIIPITETISRLFNLEIHKRDNFEFIAIMSFIYSIGIFKRFHNFLKEQNIPEEGEKIEIIANKIYCFCFASVMTLFVCGLLNYIILFLIEESIRIYYFFKLNFHFSILGLKVSILILIIYLIIKGLDKIRRNIEKN